MASPNSLCYWEHDSSSNYLLLRSWCLKKGHSGGQKLEKAAGDKGVFWALLLFVGIPLPGTGAWTGTLAASILDWDFKRSVIAVMLGVILAGIIMGTLSLLLGVNTFAH